MLRGYHFYMEDIQKGYFFCQKWHLKGCISWRSLSLLATLPSSPNAFCTVSPVLLLHRASNKFAEYKTQYNACNTSGAPNGNFRENICSEDDLRSRIFGAFVVKFLASLPLLGFSNIYKML